MGASTNSNFVKQYRLPGTFSAICSYDMLKNCVETAEEMNVRFKVGNLLSSDTFYADEEGVAKEQTANALWTKMGISAIEMEAAALYMNAARCNKNALAICTISDHIVTGEATSAEERQNSFTEMMQLALRTAKKLG